jgi:membrane protein implicated in regulation of membrane protease activity
MTSLLLTWTGIFHFIGRAFMWVFKFMPGIGFYLNFGIWIILSIAFFYWLRKQAVETKKAQAEGRLV